MRPASVRLAACLLFFGSVCFLPAAQDKDVKLKGQLPQHFKKLGLKDEQVQKIYKIQADFRTKAQDLEKQIRELKAKEKGEIEGSLTEVQKTLLKDLRTGEKTKTN
ncbi:MAG: hypothetical protein EXR99_05235 [Gemmataceae bacterium]|nr:hypothetical protein [Gemmataceae bacterium]